MSELLRGLRNHFDVIIVDSPPLLPLIDGRILAEQADSVILAVGWDRTSEDVLMRAVDLLGPVYDRIVGTVLTRVDFSRFKFYEPYGSDTYGSSYLQPTVLQEAAK
jgi:Mrp family chromosome partitioning ATPase